MNEKRWAVMGKRKAVLVNEPKVCHFCGMDERYAYLVEFSDESKHWLKCRDPEVCLARLAYLKKD